MGTILAGSFQFLVCLVTLCFVVWYGWMKAVWMFLGCHLKFAVICPCNVSKSSRKLECALLIVE